MMQWPITGSHKWICTVEFCQYFFPKVYLLLFFLLTKSPISTWTTTVKTDLRTQAVLFFFFSIAQRPTFSFVWCILFSFLISLLNLSSVLNVHAGFCIRATFRIMHQLMTHIWLWIVHCFCLLNELSESSGFLDTHTVSNKGWATVVQLLVGL